MAFWSRSVVPVALLSLVATTPTSGPVPPGVVWRYATIPAVAGLADVGGRAGFATLHAGI